MSETPARLAERAGLAGLQLPSGLGDKLVIYYELLERWNRKINLTSLVNLDEAIDRLLLEPVAAAARLPREVPMMDLGSGGGSPAIPLALSLNTPLLVMVESRSRKAAFLREAARELGLSAQVENARFEDLDYGSDVQLVSVRAVRTDLKTLELAGGFLSPGGLLALFRSAPIDAAEPLPPILLSRGTTPLLGRAHLQLFERI